MLTLPLDLVLHIVDVGDLNINDVFNLYNVNKLFRQKLLHPYFWNVLYKRVLGTIYSQLDIENDPQDYYTACRTIYKCHLELEHSMEQLHELCFSSHLESTSGGPLMNLPWTSKQYKRYCLDTNYLPTLLRMLKLENMDIQIKSKKAQARFDFLKASVLEHLLSNQMYNIGLKNIRRINSQELSPTSVENMLFNLSLLESKSYRHFHHRRRFFKKKLKLLDKYLKAYVVQTYSTLHNDVAKRQFYLQYINQGLHLLLTKMEPRVSRENSAIIENFDVSKLYSGKCKAHPYLLFAVATKIVYEGWTHFGLKAPSSVESPICTPWCVIHQDVYFDYVNLKLTIHKHEFGLHDSLNTHQLMTYLFQLFDLFREVNGLKTTDFASTMSIRGFENCCTDVNFITKIKFPHQSWSTKFKFDEFVEHLREEDALLHEVVLEHAIGVPNIKNNVNNTLLYLRGHVIRKRHNKAAVMLSADEPFCKVLTVSGTIETIRSGFVRMWLFESILEVNAFIHMVGLNSLFSVGFRFVDINLDEGYIVFGSNLNDTDL